MKVSPNILGGATMPWYFSYGHQLQWITKTESIAQLYT